MRLQEPNPLNYLRFGTFEFDERRGELSRLGGEPIPLRPRAEALLRLFLAQPGRLVSRSELHEALWPKTVVTDDSLVQCVGELRSALGDHEQLIIKTVRGRGYRWELTVERIETGEEAHAVAASNLEGPAVAIDTTISPTMRPAVPWFAMVVIAAAALGILAFRFAPSHARYHIDEVMAAHNTIAIMPFSAAPNDAEAQNLAALAADAITAQFATRRGVRGVGRASTGAYAGLPLDQIASHFQARQVVVGQVSRGAKNSFAIDVQLISAAGGDIVWSKHLETSADNSSVRIELGQFVVNAVRTRRAPSKEAEEVMNPDVPEGVKQTVLGWRDFDQRKSLVDVRRARARFEDALRADPESIIASNGLAVSYLEEMRDPKGTLTRAQVATFEGVVEHTRRIAPDDATALEIWGDMQMLCGRFDLAIPAIEKSIDIVPSYPKGYLLLARAKLLTGHADDVESLANMALKRGDGDPRRVSSAYLIAAEAALLLGEFDRATRLAGQSIAALPSNVEAHWLLAQASLLEGSGEKANSELAEVRKSRPEANWTLYEGGYPSSNPAYLAQRLALADALRKVAAPLR